MRRRLSEVSSSKEKAKTQQDSSVVRRVGVKFLAVEEDLMKKKIADKKLKLMEDDDLA